MGIIRTAADLRRHFRPRRYHSFRDFKQRARNRLGKKLVFVGKPHMTECLQRIYPAVADPTTFFAKLFHNQFEYDESKFEWTKKKFEVSIRNPQIKMIRALFWDLLWKTPFGYQRSASIPTLWEGMKELFDHGRIPQRLLSASVPHMWKGGDMCTKVTRVLAARQAKASILDPTFVHYLLSGVPHERVFCPTLSWGSTALAAKNLAGCQEYVGIDVIPEVCQIVEEEILGTSSLRKRIVCQPSEDVLRDADFLHAYEDHFDVVFFSPPYFTAEMYPDTDKTQSWSRYTIYDKWLEGYLKPTIQLIAHVSQLGATMYAIVGGRMSADFERLCSESGFIPSVERRTFRNRRSLDGAEEGNDELVYTFRLATKRVAQQTLNRLLTRTKRDGDCLLWTGAIKRGHARQNGRNVRDKVYELGHGSIANGDVVIQTCDNKMCCKPEHLR